MAINALELIKFLQGYPYLYSFLILASFFILSKLVVFIFEKVLMKFALKTKTTIDDQIIIKSNRPISAILFFIGIRLAVIPLALEKTLTKYINYTIGSLIGLAITILIVRIVDILLDAWGTKIARKTRTTFDDELLPIFHKFSKIVIYILGILYILSIWGVKIGPFLASLGIAGLAVAFALQNTLGNIFGGITLIIDKTFKAGDIVKLESGQLGVIDTISLRSTRIRTFDNEYIIVPNGKLANSIINNWMLPNRKIRISIDFGVAYGSKIEEVKKLVMELIKKEKKALKEPAPYVIFTKMNESSLDFIARFWVDDINDKLMAKERITTNIYNALNKAGISIPFPQMDIHLKK